MPKTSTPEMTEQPRYVLGAGGATEILLPDGLSCVPTRVQELSDEAVRAHDAAQLASAQLRAAEAGLRRAEGVDAAADRAAAAAGEALPGKRAVDGAKEALQLAERRHRAARQNARDAVTELARGIAKDKGTWVIGQRGTVDAIRADLRGTLDTLVAQLAALDRERQVLAALHVFPGQGSLHEVRFGRPDRHADRHAADRADAVAGEIAGTPGNTLRSTIPRATPYLLAELKRQVESPEAPTSAVKS